MGKRTPLGMAVLVLGAAFPVVAADEPIGSPRYRVASDNAPRAAAEPETYGTVSLTALSLSAFGFTPVMDGQWAHFANGFSMRGAGANSTTCIGVNLPSGAILTNITTYTNDTNASSDISYFLYSMNLATGASTTPFVFTTSGEPGIERVLRAVTPNVVVNNNQNAYALCVDHGAVGLSNQHAGATLWYRLQVSPAPATATFSDVPVGGGQHRFVEALAAAGITGGCGGGQYCPNNPVTRGEMAVFLSVALGLHFPN